MLNTASLGFSSIGFGQKHRNALSDFLDDKISENELYKTGYQIRQENIKIYKDVNIDIVPVNDFTWHDELWDTSVLIGNIPNRYYWEGGYVPLDIYFAPTHGQRKDKFEVEGMEIRPYFNTRTYYTVPEFDDEITLMQSDNKIIQHYLEAKSRHYNSRPVLFGPVSYILLSKLTDVSNIDKDEECITKILDGVLAVYEAIFNNLHRINVKKVQINEPCISSNLSIFYKKLYKYAYDKIRSFAKNIEITAFLGFSDFAKNEDFLFQLPIDVLHIDITQKSINNRLNEIISKIDSKKISLGVIDSSSVFISDINSAILQVEKVLKKFDEVTIAPSTSLAYLPLDINEDKSIPSYVKQYLSFGVQKIQEVSLIKDCINGNQRTLKIANTISKLHKEYYTQISSTKKAKLPKYVRTSRDKRRGEQMDFLKINKTFPMTTIGVFGKSYSIKKASNAEVKKIITEQDQYGFDVLSTGEMDRKSLEFDYFVDFVKSGIYNYGTSIIKTYFNQFENIPIIFDPKIALHDNSKLLKMFDLLNLTTSIANVMDKQVKYRIIGPVTALHRSFCFNKYEFSDIFLSHIADMLNYIAKKAIENGAGVIQIDENNICSDFETDIIENNKHIAQLKEYITGVYSNIDSKIPIHMYIKNAYIVDFIDDLNDFDADLLILESFRSKNDILQNLSGYSYDGDIAIGVVDFASFYAPSAKDISDSLKSSIRVFDIDKLWITYDHNFRCSNIDIKAIMENINTVVNVYRNKYQ